MEDVKASNLPRRSAQDRYLGGVAGGIAETWGIDPFVIRAVLLGSTLFTVYAADWIAIIPGLYTLFWLLLPEQTHPSLIRRIRTRPALREACGAVASWAVIALLLSKPAFGVALALAALAWVLLSDGPSDPSTQAPEEEPTAGVGESGGDHASTNESDVTSARMAWGRSRRRERGETTVSSFVKRTPRLRRQPALWPLTLALLAVLAVGAGALDSVLADGIDPGVVVNLALIAVGAVIAISSWRGRALGTLAIAALLLPLWIGFSVADIGRFSGDGSMTVTPLELPESGVLSYERGYGSLTIDLRQLPLADAERATIEVKATAGNVLVLSHSDVAAIVNAKIGAGTSTVRGNGIAFYEYDREPYVDRFTSRSYPARGIGCLDYWATWQLTVDAHRAAGVALADLDAAEADAVDAIVAAIVAAGYATPTAVDEAYDHNRAPIPIERQAFDSVMDEFGNEYQIDLGDALNYGSSPQDQVIVSDRHGNQYIIARSYLDRSQPRDALAEDSTAENRVRERTWSYRADHRGTPCIEQPAPDKPAIIEVNATIGIGTLEVRRDEY